MDAIFQLVQLLGNSWLRALCKASLEWANPQRQLDLRVDRSTKEKHTPLKN